MSKFTRLMAYIFGNDGKWRTLRKYGLNAFLRSEKDIEMLQSAKYVFSNEGKTVYDVSAGRYITIAISKKYWKKNF